MREGSKDSVNVMVAFREGKEDKVGEGNMRFPLSPCGPPTYIIFILVSLCDASFIF